MRDNGREGNWEWVEKRVDGKGRELSMGRMEQEVNGKCGDWKRE